MFCPQSSPQHGRDEDLLTSLEKRVGSAVMSSEPLAVADTASDTGDQNPEITANGSANTHPSDNHTFLTTEAQEAASALTALASQAPRIPYRIETSRNTPSPLRNSHHPPSDTNENTFEDAGSSARDVASFSVAAIKEEPMGTPQPSTPAESLPKAVDDETAKAIAAAQNEYNTRVRLPKKEQDDMVPITEVEIPRPAPKATTMKKKPGPKPGASAEKSVAAGIKKPPPKKRKIESSEERSTPTSSKQSPAPSTASARASKTPGATKARKGSQSATPQASSPAIASSPTPDSDDASDNELYCICRKPDNHTWMIGCDGGCEDWFHGKCVNIKKEDEDLIDKYICPGCQEKGRGVTTWKPMCRRDGCRKPARLKRGAESKYCSQECGIAFMKGTLKRAEQQVANANVNPRSKSTTNTSAQQEYDARVDVGPLGGVIRSNEIKALADSTSEMETFKRLGSDFLPTPPPSTSPETRLNLETNQQMDISPTFTASERERLDEIAAQKVALKNRRLLLKERGQFVSMMKAQVARVVEKLKVKDVCGFDSRWSWDDTSFKKWRDSEEGAKAFEQGTLDTAVRSIDEKANADNNSATGLSPATPVTDEPFSYVCTKRRCERHRQWQKLVLQDVRFEEADVGNEMRRIDREGKEIVQNAATRTRENLRSADGDDGGWVEEVSDTHGEEHDTHLRVPSEHPVESL